MKMTWVGKFLLVFGLLISSTAFGHSIVKFSKADGWVGGDTSSLYTIGDLEVYMAVKTEGDFLRYIVYFKDTAGRNQKIGMALSKDPPVKARATVRVKPDSRSSWSELYPKTEFITVMYLYIVSEMAE